MKKAGRVARLSILDPIWQRKAKNVLTILSDSPRVKFFKARNRLDAAKAEALPAEFAENRPVYRAVCDCGWYWKSDDWPHEPMAARTKAQSHADVQGHEPETVFDVIGQKDMTFRHRGEIENR